MRIVAFAASTSRRSINKQLVNYAADLIHDGLVGPGATMDVLDIGDYEMPIYSIDRQEEDGIPDLAHRFLRHLASADALVISFAEHNGHYTAAYKNLYDWVSRIDRKVYQEKPMVLLSSSPGARGGARVLEVATTVAERQGADVRAALAIPHFNDVFDVESGRLVDDEADAAFRRALSTLTPIDGRPARPGTRA